MVQEKYEFHKAAPLMLSDGTVLRRIVALRDIPLQSVKAGDIGGYIENEKILKQTDNAWVGGNAMVYGQSRVLEDCLVTDDAEVLHSLLRGDVVVSGNAELTEVTLTGPAIRIKDDAKLTNVAFVGENVLISGEAELTKVFGRSNIRAVSIGENAILTHDLSMGIEGTDIQIWGNAQLRNASSLNGNSIKISGDAILENGADIKGNDVTLKDYCVVTGKVTLGDNVTVMEFASVKISHDDLNSTVSNTVFNGDTEYDVSPF